MGALFNFKVLKRLDKVEDLLERISRMIDRKSISLDERINTMTTAFETLTVEVAETKGVANSIKLQLEKLSAYIQANAANEQAMLDLAASLDSDQAGMLDAILKNPVPGEVVLPPTE